MSDFDKDFGRQNKKVMKMPPALVTKPFPRIIRLSDKVLQLPIAGYVKKYSRVKEATRDHRTTAGERDAESSFHSVPKCRKKYYPYLRNNQFRQFPALLIIIRCTEALKTLNGKLLSFGKAAGDNSFLCACHFLSSTTKGSDSGSFIGGILAFFNDGKRISLPHGF